MNILQINASARREAANSTRVADSITARLQATNPAVSLTLRDLAVTPHPVLDEAALGALFTPGREAQRRTGGARRPSMMRWSPKSRPPTRSCSACRCTTSACRCS
jgi:FMN-dependent NADH-azoreductase